MHGKRPGSSGAVPADRPRGATKRFGPVREVDARAPVWESPATRVLRGAGVTTKAERVQELVASIDGTGLAGAAERARDGEDGGEAWTVAAMIWAAFRCPGGLQPVYHALGSAWAGEPLAEHADDAPDLAQAPLPDALWDALWSAVEDARRVAYTPASATRRVADIARHTHPAFLAIAERIERHHGQLEGGSNDVAPEGWAACPPGSLGQVLTEMVLANTYDPAVGDLREQRVLPPNVGRVNGHLDRFDGVWRTVAGYDSIDSHLIAFAAFSISQAGHLFSAGALAMFAAIAHLVIPNSLGILMHLIAEGWQHGRSVPSLLGVDWEPLWAEPPQLVRARLAVPAYRSAYSRNLFHVLPRYAERAEGDAPGGGTRERIAPRAPPPPRPPRSDCGPRPRFRGPACRLPGSARQQPKRQFCFPI